MVGCDHQHLSVIYSEVAGADRETRRVERPQKRGCQAWVVVRAFIEREVHGYSRGHLRSSVLRHLTDPPQHGERAFGGLLPGITAGSLDAFLAKLLAERLIDQEQLEAG